MSSQEEKTAASWLKETQKGYLRIAVLILLNRKPYHGYEIMKEINERTGGFWRPTAGGIYPILQSLEESGYIEGAWDSRQRRRRKTYRITEAGSPVLQRALARENQIAESMSGLFREFMKDVLDVKSVSTPMMPNPFSIFLEERKEKRDDSVSVLERKQKQIEEMIKAMQKQRDAISKRLAQLEQPRKTISRRRLS